MPVIGSITPLPDAPGVKVVRGADGQIHVLISGDELAFALFAPSALHPPGLQKVLRPLPEPPEKLA